jgi:VCBS repeat-containing protein
VIGDRTAVGTILDDDNRAPDAVNDAFSTGFQTPLETAISALLANDTDADGDTLSLVSVQNAQNGTVAIVDGKVVFTPAAGFSGPASYSYTVNDGKGRTDTATVTVNVGNAAPTNTAPKGNADSYAIAEDGSLIVPAAAGVLANDTDAEANPLTASLVQGPANGTLTLNANGSFNYVPNANFSGTDSFTYIAGDGSLSSAPTTVTINVTPVNDAPVAEGDSYETDEDKTLNIAGPGILANDSDVEGNPLSAILVNGPSNGILQLNANGGFDYIPNADFNGTDSFTYRANDGSANSEPVTVTINVKAVNDAPVSLADAFFLEEDTSVQGNVLTNDTDVDGQGLVAQLVAGPEHGTLTLNQDGSFSYEPNANFNGTDSFTYRAFDGTAFGDPQTVTLQVSSVNDVPVAVDDNGLETAYQQPLEIEPGQLLANDSDLDGDTLSIVAVQDAVNGTVAIVDGKILFTPKPGYSGPASFSYTVSDGNGAFATATAAIAVGAEVPPENRGPVGVADSYSVDEDGVLVVTAANGVLANDTDATETR